jgi:hypothetical protein
MTQTQVIGFDRLGLRFSQGPGGSRSSAACRSMRFLRVCATATLICGMGASCCCATLRSS